MALKDVKAKIQATNRTHKVTRAMEAVSAVKMRKTQLAALGGRAYARAAISILARLSGSRSFLRHPLLIARAEVKTLALLVVTSDKGLAGSLNSGVIKAALEVIGTRSKDSVRIYAYGRKAEEFFSRRGYTTEKAISNRADDIILADMEALANELSVGFTAGLFDEAVAVFSNFKSTFEQVPSRRQILPLSLPALEATVREIAPEKGKFVSDEPVVAPPAYTVESAKGEILDTLVPRLVAVSIYHMLLETKASEHSARMVAMKNASDKSKEVARDLTRKYNKIRQAAITREVSEIVGGREALAS